jgi:serine O-acetyltransferase
MPTIRGILLKDISRTYNHSQGNRLCKVLACIRSPGVHAVVVFRYGQWAKMRPTLLRVFLDPVYILLNGLIQVAWGIELPRSAIVGPGFFIGHFGGITISPEATIGKNCSMSQSITIGISGSGDKCGVPIIGDNVYIAPGARIFGKITVGNNVKIGANAVIYSDVPSNAIAVLAPGFKIISLDGNPSIE